MDITRSMARRAAILTTRTGASAVATVDTDKARLVLPFHGLQVDYLLLLLWLSWDSQQCEQCSDMDHKRQHYNYSFLESFKQSLNLILLFVYLKTFIKHIIYYLHKLEYRLKHVTNSYFYAIPN
jgi:hypothetical protein